MISLTWIHWIVTLLIGMIATLLLIFSFKLKGQTRLVSLLVICLVAVMTFFISVIALDKKTKKAIITHLDNKRVLRNEEIIFKGYILNSGDFKIGTSKLEIKLINHGKGLGNVKGSDFYRTNSIFGDLFTSNKDRKKSRPGTVVNDFVIAKDLLPGERRPFVVRFKFPSYFRDVDYRLKLYNDFAEKTIRSQ